MFLKRPVAARACLIATSSAAFYNAVKARGYILYPGKLTAVETFRVGCMGQLGERGIAGAVDAVREVLREMGIRTEATQLHDAQA